MTKTTNTVLTAAKRTLGGGAAAAAVLTSQLAHAAMPAYSPVTSERLINAQQDKGWLMYRRNYESTGYAPFDQINAGNVGKLTMVFSHQSDLRRWIRIPARSSGTTSGHRTTRGTTTVPMRRS